MKLNCNCNRLKVIFTDCFPKCNFRKIRDQKILLAAVFSACLLRLGFGTVIYWTSPAVPHLTSNEAKFIITADEASWVVSLVSIGGIIGFLLYPQFINRIGRKYTMLLSAIPQVCSWIMIYYASNVYHLYAARILSGIGYYAGFVVEIIYVGEIAEKNIRGSLIILGKITYVIGCLVAVILGAIVSYDNMNLILLLMSLLFVLTFSFMPESPYFYLKMNREEDAFQSLSKLRGTRDIIALQLEIESMKEGMIKNESSDRNSLIKLFGEERNRKAVLIGSLATLSVTLSGSSAVAAYTQTIASYIETPVKPEQAAILIMVVVLISSIIIAPLPDCVGRRILTLIYGIFVALSSAVIGAFLFYQNYLNKDLSSISWIPLVALMVYIVGSSSGLYCLSKILLSELFSIEVKSSASAIIHIVSALLEFFIKLGFERLISILDIYGFFWIFGAFALIITSTNFIIMPETKGKTLEEIQILLKKT